MESKQIGKVSILVAVSASLIALTVYLLSLYILETSQNIKECLRECTVTYPGTTASKVVRSENEMLMCECLLRKNRIGYCVVCRGQPPSPCSQDK